MRRRSTNSAAPSDGIELVVIADWPCTILGILITAYVQTSEVKGMQMPDICNAKGTPLCSCGLEMVFCGRDGNYLKYRCPEAVGKGVCKSRFKCTSSPYGYVLKLPINDDPRRHPPVPRESKKWQRLYRLRTATKRVNSRVKELLGLGTITLRGIGKVTVRAMLSLLVMLAAGVGMTRRHRLSELRIIVT